MKVEGGNKLNPKLYTLNPKPCYLKPKTKTFPEAIEVEVGNKLNPKPKP